MSEVGIELKNAREKLGYDYDYIYQKTKIHPRVLRALEEGDYQYFSSWLYLKSFLQKYAEFLELDSSWMLEKIKEEFKQEVKKIEPAVAISASFLSPLEKLLFGAKVMLSFLLVIAFIYIIFFGVGKIASSIFYSKPELRKKTGSQEKIVPPASSKFEKKEVKKDQVLKIKSPLELSIEAKEDCWLQLRADNEKIFEGILRKGERESWKAEKEFELWVGEASRLELTLNGIPLGPIGRGVIKGIKINSSGIKLP